MEINIIATDWQISHSIISAIHRLEFLFWKRLSFCHSSLSLNDRIETVRFLKFSIVWHYVKTFKIWFPCNVYCQVRGQFASDSVFSAVSLESERGRIFKEFVSTLESRSKTSKKKSSKKHRRRSRSSSVRFLSRFCLIFLISKMEISLQMLIYAGFMIWRCPMVHNPTSSHPSSVLPPFSLSVLHPIWHPFYLLRPSIHYPTLQSTCLSLLPTVYPYPLPSTCLHLPPSIRLSFSAFFILST